MPSGSAARLLTGTWWFADRTAPGPGRGRWVIGQVPNPAITVFAVCTLLGWLPLGGPDGSGGLDPELVLVGRGALVVWGADELVRGVNPFRRVLGLLVLAWQVVSLLAGA